MVPSTRTSISLRVGMAPLGCLGVRMSGLHFHHRGCRRDRELRSRHRLHADPRSRWADAAVGHSDRTRRRSAGAVRVQNAMGGDCALRLLFADGRFFHTGAEQAIQLQKNIAVVRGFLALALLGPGAWSLEDWRGEPSSEGCFRGALPIAPREAIDFGHAAIISSGQVGSRPLT